MPTNDIIYFRELKIETIIGVHPWEQQVQQLVVLDLELTFDIRKAARSGSVTDTIDYAELAKRISSYVSEKKFVLLETLIEEVADLILNEFKVIGVKVCVSKPGAVPGIKNIGITIERFK